MLARVVSRGDELAIRRALGATHLRIWRLLLRECLGLTLISSLFGLGFGVWAATVIPLDRLLQFTALIGSSIDSYVVAAVAGVTLLAAVLLASMALLPTLRQTFGLVHGHRHAPVTSVMHRKTRNAFVVAQFALLLPLLAYSLQSLSSLYHLTTRSRGYDTTHVVAGLVVLPGEKYNSPEKRSAFLARLRGKMAESGLPTGIVDELPLGRSSGSAVSVVAGGRPVMATSTLIDGDYFTTLGILTADHKGSLADDQQHLGRDVIISRSLAHGLWHTADVVGETLTLEGEDRPRRVLAVVDDVAAPMPENLPAPQLYMSFRWPFRGLISTNEVAIVARPQVVSRAASIIRKSIKELDREAYVTRLQELETLLAESLAEPRIRTEVVTICTIFAALIAVLGLYGIVACSLETRRSEFGLRLALGATVSDLIRQVLMESSTLAVIGAGLGVGLTLFAAKVLESVIVDFNASDVTSIAAACVLLIGATIVTTLRLTARMRSVSPSELLHIH